MKMNNDDKFILIAGLEEGMLDVWEGDINSVALLWEEPDSVLVDL